MQCHIGHVQVPCGEFCTDQAERQEMQTEVAVIGVLGQWESGVIVRTCDRRRYVHDCVHGRSYRPRTTKFDDGTGR